MREHWRRSNLVAHHNKHAKMFCCLCWGRLLAKPAPVAVTDYENESLKTISDPALTFNAFYRENPGDKDERHRYYVNSHLILAAVQAATHEIKTCYRWHSPRQRHSLDHDLASWLRMIERLADKRFCDYGRMTGYDTVSVKAPLLTEVDRRALWESTKQLKTLRQKRVNRG